MKLAHLFVSFLLLFLSSCDCINSFEGSVVDENNQPLAGVKVYYLIDGVLSDSTTTSEDGRIELSEISGMCDEKENDIILFKKGFQHLVLNDFATDKTVAVLKQDRSENLSIDQALDLYQPPSWMHLYNILIVVLNIVSLGFVFKPAVKFKVLWVILFVIINPCVVISRTGELIDWNILGFLLDPNYSKSLWMREINIPSIAILFWVYFIYFRKAQQFTGLKIKKRS